MNTFYMVQVKFSPSDREKVLQYFAEHGVAAYREQIEVLSHWTCTHEPVSYLLIESRDNDQAQAAFQAWGSLGEVTAHEIVEAVNF